MKRHTESLSKRMLEISEELTNDLKLSDFNIKETSLKTPALKAKYVQIHYEEQRYLNKLEDALEKCKDDYIRNHGKEGVPKFVTQKESESIDKVKKLEKVITEQKEVVRYTNEILKTVISGFGWDIRNCIDLIKVENT